MQLWDFFEGTPERVRNSHGKRAISVRAIEVLLYYDDQMEHKICGVCPVWNAGLRAQLQHIFERYSSDDYQYINRALEPCVCVCIPILVTMFPEWLPGAMRSSSLCL